MSYGAHRLAAAGGRVCCIWNTTTHQLVHRLTFASEISALWMASDRSAVAIATGAVVTVVDAATGASRFSYAHSSDVASVHIDGPARLLASADVLGEVRIVDTTSGELVRVISAAPGRPIVHLHQGKYLLVGSDTHSTILDAVTGEVLRRFSYDPNDSPAQTGLLLASTLVAHHDTRVQWFDCTRFAAAHCVRDLGSRVQNIDLYEPHGLALAATESGGLHLFDLKSGEPVACHGSFTSPVFAARFGPKGLLYVAGGEALVMQIVDGRHVRSYCDESPPLVAMTAHPGKAALLVSDRDGGIAQIDLRTGRTRRWHDTTAGSVSAVAASVELIATGSYDGRLRLLGSTLNHPATIDLSQGPVQSILLDTPVHRAWVGTWAGRLNCVDLTSHQVVATVQACGSSLRSLALDASGLHLCAGGDSGEIVLFDIGEGMRRVVAHQQVGTVYRAFFDAGGHLWTTAGDGVRRYDRANLTHRRTYPGTQIRWFELSGERLYSLGLKGEFQAFDIESGKLLDQTKIATPVNHRSIAVLGPDRIATASADGLVRIFDARLREVATLELLREGYLWCTPAAEAHPGWVHTDQPHLLCVGERDPSTSDASVAFTESDPRRARHLAVFRSESHVMHIVRATASATGALDATTGHRLGGLGPSQQLGWRRDAR